MTKPLLRWPGGKRRLLAEITTHMPCHYNMLHEPFAGGAALTFNLQPQGGFLSDRNAELINLYRAVKYQPQTLINHLSCFANNRETFMKLRAAERKPDFMARDLVWRAARYLYLNRTCFNGVMRVNSKNQLNCSYGGDKPDSRVYDAAPIWIAHAILRPVRLSCTSFAETLKTAQEGDFVYFDPPYVPVKAAGTIAYTPDNFDLTSQGALANLCAKLTRKGVYWMVSNADVAFIRKLYGHYYIHDIGVSHVMSGRAKGRGLAREVMIVNYPCGTL